MKSCNMHGKLARSFAIEITHKFYKDDNNNIAITVIVEKVAQKIKSQAGVTIILA